MDENEIVRAQIFEIIKNQVKENKPPETKSTYNRLLKQGYNDFEANQLIGQCIALELFDVLKYKKPWNEKRYIKNLCQLPQKPFE